MSEIVESPATEEAAAPPVVAEEAEAETPAPEEAASDEVVLEIPDSSQEGGKARLVPASALSGARKELKELKAELNAAKEGSAKAAQLEQQIAQLQQQVQQMSPYVQAYQAAVQQQQQPAQEDDTEARELAQSLDLYKPDGTPDVDKAKKVMGLVDRRAKANAQAEVAPIQQRTIAQQSSYNLQRALNTEVNGVKPDPGIMRMLWNRMDPSITAQEETAKHLVIQAIGMTVMQGKAHAQPAAQRTPNGQFAKADEIPAPLHIEKAGGKDTPNAMPLSEKERAALKDLGMTEKEYLESARSASWLR